MVSVCKVLGHPVDVFLDNNMTRVRKVKERGASWPLPSRSERSGRARTAGYQGGRESRLPRKGGREGQEKIRRVKWSFVIDISRKLLFPQREYYSRVNEFGFDISVNTTPLIKKELKSLSVYI